MFLWIVAAPSSRSRRLRTLLRRTTGNNNTERNPPPRHIGSTMDPRQTLKATWRRHFTSGAGSGLLRTPRVREPNRGTQTTRKREKHETERRGKHKKRTGGRADSIPERNTNRNAPRRMPFSDSLHNSFELRTFQTKTDSRKERIPIH